MTGKLSSTPTSLRSSRARAGVYCALPVLISQIARTGAALVLPSRDEGQAEPKLSDGIIQDIRQIAVPHRVSDPRNVHDLFHDFFPFMSRWSQRRKVCRQHSRGRRGRLRQIILGARAKCLCLA
jgi:hypothetical protein